MLWGLVRGEKACGVNSKLAGHVGVSVDVPTVCSGPFPPSLLLGDVELLVNTAEGDSYPIIIPDNGEASRELAVVMGRVLWVGRTNCRYVDVSVQLETIQRNSLRMACCCFEMPFGLLVSCGTAYSGFGAASYSRRRDRPDPADSGYWQHCRNQNRSPWLCCCLQSLGRARGDLMSWSTRGIQQRPGHLARSSYHRPSSRPCPDRRPWSRPGQSTPIATSLRMISSSGPSTSLRPSLVKSWEETRKKWRASSNELGRCWQSAHRSWCCWSSPALGLWVWLRDRQCSRCHPASGLPWMRRVRERWTRDIPVRRPNRSYPNPESGVSRALATKIAVRLDPYSSQRRATTVLPRWSRRMVMTSRRTRTEGRLDAYPPRWSRGGARRLASAVVSTDAKA